MDLSTSPGTVNGLHQNVPASKWTAEDANGPQVEIVNAITAAGLTPAAGDLTQLAVAIGLLANLPTGIISPWSTDTPPAGWLECDGSELDRGVYAELFAKIGVVYGAGNGSTTFELPDLRGDFIRGWDHGATVDPDRASRTAHSPGTATGDNIGTRQADEVVSHSHTLNTAGSVLQGSYVAESNANTATTALAINAFGGNETRPRNVNTMFIIKY